MPAFTLAWQGQSLRLECPDSLAADIGTLFGALIADSPAPARTIRVTETAGRFGLEGGAEPPVAGLSRADIANHLMDAVITGLITDQRQGIVLHAGAVARNGQAVLVAGQSGAGKSSLICWLVDQGFEFLTDEIVLLRPGAAEVVGLPRSPVLKPGSMDTVLAMPAFAGARTVQAGAHVMIDPPLGASSGHSLPVALILFPDFAPGRELSMAGVTAAAAGLQLMGCNLNARNLADGGLRAVTQLARQAPALHLRYGDFDQLPGRIDTLVALAAEGTLAGGALRRFLTGLRPPADPAAPSAKAAPRRAIPAPTPLRAQSRALTIGMATYDDYDGVYFTLQALRMYHADALADTEILVVDNNPAGPCAAALKALEAASADYRYVPASGRTGTLAAKQRVADEARGEHVLVMDCHVLLWPGALARLRRYIADNPGARDLLQGPLVYDDLGRLATHMQPQWRGGALGTWDSDPRAADLDAPPFEIPMQGLGLYAFRRSEWPGYNAAFRGFGVEEWYLHEKVRRRGGRTLCLPFLRWVHRFGRPMGVPYPNNFEDRIRNYLIALSELGEPTAPMEQHFNEFLGAQVAGPIIRAARRDIAGGQPAATTAPSSASRDTAS